ncbi:MAG TPA: isoprenylcysteine carboxylmethyltransferase family protein [Gemmatimonadaceae bacterium]|nr:isoprenylcysteine carboxylmethyltransferase family protein [Gemmatimonadaceae bacterium]
MLTPIPFTWPLGAIFFVVLFWSYWPESRIMRAARRAERAKAPTQRDRSYRPLVMGQQVVIFIAVFLAFAKPSLAMRSHREAVFFVGLVVMIGASIFRRHCFRMLGADFRGDVTVRPDQPVVDRGAYHYLRHPSYLAAMLMHLGFGLCFTHWGTLAVLMLAVPPLFVYRIHVEERALRERLGATYVAYADRTKRLIPGLW